MLRLRTRRIRETDPGVNPMDGLGNLADAMLVLLTADKNISRTLPGKVQTYMAAGKPILAAADGETPLILAEAACG